VLPIDG